MPRPPADQLERLRAYRNRPERDISIGSSLARQAEEARRIERRLGRLIEAWSATVPRPLLTHTSIVSFGRGVLTVNVDTAAARYELEQRLRSGLLEALRAAYGGSLHRVRTRLQSPGP